jgi:addiction module RelE/StbE family toxin
MVEIKTIVFTEKFEKNVKSIKDNRLKEHVKKQIEKMINNPDIGKPLRYNLKNEKTLYVKPYRLIYAVEKDKLILLRFLHRDEVYR